METIDRMITSNHHEHDHENSDDEDDHSHGGCNHDNMNVRAAFIHVISKLRKTFISISS